MAKHETRLNTLRHYFSLVAAKMTASTISENKDLGKMDWDKMTSVIRSTINLDEEGMLNYRLALHEIMAYFCYTISLIN